jgi:hypothetical protein
MTRLEAWTQLYAAALTGRLAGRSQQIFFAADNSGSDKTRMLDILAQDAKQIADRAILVWDEVHSKGPPGNR